ncbi:TMEM165/GDT1 family protein [Sphingopyxis sp. SE2]|jgi:putative Ca2+/H+ antiporter (TMEM165/GDT1 family)|uniref:TMEM165/GDT1 family protein n=1 Tax=unclassified Sphingopyxis TaxID=2614943 RepID=UPI00056A7FE1|nr:MULTISPECIES: TMEM165/GDT1 family protein [unclassified Sphingopyxis]MDT7529703.1 TMEM165/GDT1 family protein [Sphingopyxis sp. SE2]
MDAIMLALVAVLLANADGRSGIALSRLVSARSDRRATVGIAFGAFIVNAIVAAIAGAIANRMIGQGVAALLVALAMLSAAVALLWPMKPAREEGDGDAPTALFAGRMLANQFGDRSHFLIAALAATSGAGQWAAAGGLVGWTLSMLPFLAFGPALAERRAARGLRWAAAAILVIWGLRTALGAFGLIG